MRIRIFFVVITMMLATVAFSFEKPLEFQDITSENGIDVIFDEGDAIAFGGPDGLLNVRGPATVNFKFDEQTQLLRGDGKIVDTKFVTPFSLTDKSCKRFYKYFPRVRQLVDEEGFTHREEISLYEMELSVLTQSIKDAYAVEYETTPDLENEYLFDVEFRPFLESLCETACTSDVVFNAEISGRSKIDLYFDEFQLAPYSIGLYSAEELELRRMERESQPDPTMQMTRDQAKTFVLLVNKLCRHGDADVNLKNGTKLVSTKGRED